ncbi:MAG TPA: glycosyltransferase, partial [Acidimicrobiia bacterium]|nr:glycosyltransferase [Acidimicrobiia bacterium]
PPRHASWAELVGRDELHRLLETASAVVCHGGPASITECRSAGIVPIVVPRDPRLGEHVDDHQILFTRRLAAAGKIHLARSADRLAALLDEAVSCPEAFRVGPGADTAEQTVVEFERLVTGLLHGDDGSRHHRRVRALAGRRR